MYHKKYLAAAIVIWAINFSGTASASMNTNDCIFTLDEVVVKGLRYRYNVSKYGDKAENVPFSYTVVNEKDMEERKVESLKDTLNYTAVSSEVSLMKHCSTTAPFAVSKSIIPLSI